MKVLFVNENIDGHVTTHLHLKRALATRGDIDARFLDVPAPGLGRKLLSTPVPGLARLDLDLQPLRSQLSLSAWTRRHLAAPLRDADVVHVFTHNAALLSAGLLASVPAVIALDSTNSINAYALPYRTATRFTPWAVAVSKVFERRVYQAADVLVATSAVAARSLREDYGAAADRVRAIHYGITAPRFAAAAAPGTGAQWPRLVFVGRSLWRKGGLQLLRLHQQQLADRCELLLVTGEHVPPGRNVTVVNDLRPGDDRLWEILRGSAVFVFPSRVDQQPNSVMEAMAAGLPVIAHPINAIGDMVVDGVTGLTLTGTDDAALVVAIARLLDDAELRARLGAAGRARFDERFSALVTTGSLVGALRDAITLHRASAAK